MGLIDKIGHLSIKTKTPDILKQYLERYFGFICIANRHTEKSYFLQNNQISFRLLRNDFDSNEPDRVSDIAIYIHDIKKVLENLKQVDSRIISHEKKDDYESFVISSCFPGLTHTLIESRKNSIPVIKNCAITKIDHIALACHVGETDNIISWYEKVFETKRSPINESQKNKFEFTVKVGMMGMKLQAFDYWKCSKTHLYSDASDFKFVIVEPLTDSAPNQVSRFLEDNHGPGVQHLAFYSENILQSIKTAVNNGLKFQVPPPGYYNQLVEKHGQSNISIDLEELKQSGALLDFEPCGTDQQKFNYDRYLLQIFTKPVFNANTLFLELIYRHGSTGFGEGNIDALWRSVEKSFKKNVSS